MCNESLPLGIGVADNVQQIAEKIRPTVDKYQQAFPALLEIPSKDHPYGALHLGLFSVCFLQWIEYMQYQDPSKDSILKRVQKLFGE